jgi:acetyl-CoA synthetase
MTDATEKIAEKSLPVDEKYDPPAGYRCHVPNFEHYLAMHKRSIGPDRDRFWREQAETLRWKKPFHQVFHEDFTNGDIRWFLGGKLNVCDNCVDRWAEQAPDRVAIIYEGDEPTDTKKITFGELLMETCRLANMYKYYNAKKGDRITIYMPMIPEAAYCMLASARIGLIHSVVFAGFSAASLRDRILDAASPFICTADEGHGRKPLRQDMFRVQANGWQYQDARRPRCVGPGSSCINASVLPVRRHGL